MNEWMITIPARIRVEPTKSHQRSWFYQTVLVFFLIPRWGFFSFFLRIAAINKFIWELCLLISKQSRFTLVSPTSWASEVEAFVTLLTELKVRPLLEFLVKTFCVAFITWPNISGLILSKTSIFAGNPDTDAPAKVFK